MDSSNELLIRLGQIIKGHSVYQQRTGNDKQYNQFIETFPSGKLKALTLDDYCMGKDSKEGNFSWWIERGLKEVLGGFSLGNATGHIIYKQKDGTYFRVKALEQLLPEDALVENLKVHHTIANANVDQELTWIDNDSDILERAGVNINKFAIGNGRKLRILSAYHPDFAIPITSSDHIGYFLIKLGTKSEELPPIQQAVKRMLMLREYYLVAKEEYNTQLTPFGFMKALYSDELGIRPMKTSKQDIDTDDFSYREYPEWIKITDPDIPVDLNQILYGPPGTGKTFITTELAVKLADSAWHQDLYENVDWGTEYTEKLKQRYADLVEDNRITFTTFHQSFSYEDFFEGIRASTNETGNISYEIEDGIFKTICINASSKVTQTSDEEQIDLEGRRIWKMSLGYTGGNDGHIFQECIENNYALLGYGDYIDFNGCDSRDAVLNKFVAESGQEHKNDSYAVTSVHTFKNVIKEKDLFIVTDGNKKFRAIGEITGEYKFLNTDDHEGYQQMRPVKWLRQFEPSLPKERLFIKGISQMTLYQLKSKAIDIDKLSKLLAPQSENDTEQKPHVLIIDEINRGNVSRIFGELITLLEPDKRLGGSDERSVRLPYSKEQFSVPDNLYVIGTMNTADKSLAQIDIALRRRFDFFEMEPKPELLEEVEVYGILLSEILATINQRIEVLLDREHRIGHAYFMQLVELETDDEIEDALAHIFEQKVIPLLQEYFFDDWEKISWVLNDPAKNEAHRFIQSIKTPALSDLFTEEVSQQLNDRRFRVNTEVFYTPEAYTGILSNRSNTLQ